MGLRVRLLRRTQIYGNVFDPDYVMDLKDEADFRGPCMRDKRNKHGDVLKGADGKPLQEQIAPAEMEWVDDDTKLGYPQQESEFMPEPKKFKNISEVFEHDKKKRDAEGKVKRQPPEKPETPTGRTTPAAPTGPKEPPAEPKGDMPPDVAAKMETQEANQGAVKAALKSSGRIRKTGKPE